MQFDGSMPEVPALAASSDAEFWSTPPGTGKTHLSIGLAIKAAHTRHRIAFATAVDWVARLKAAHNAGRLPAELAKLRRIGLLVVDEVGYIRLVEYLLGTTALEA